MKEIIGIMGVLEHGVVQPMFGAKAATLPVLDLNHSSEKCFGTYCKTWKITIKIFRILYVR